MMPEKRIRMANDGDNLGQAPTSGTSPWRWLLVIVPLGIMVAAIISLLDVWSARLQDAARDAWRQVTQEFPIPAPEPRPAPPEPTRDSDPITFPPEPPPPPPPRRQADTAERFNPATIVALLPRADIESGARQFQICSICHTAELGAGHRIGPNLWNVVGRPKAHDPDFNYSQALRDKGGAWTAVELAAYLYDPRAFAPGTSMSFAGVRDPQRLANVIAYLQTLTDADE